MKADRWLSSLRDNWRSPYWWRGSVLQFLGGLYYRKIKGNAGEYVMEKDWDNLLVLDACRLDLYKEVANPDCDSMVSRGAATPEWLRENFQGRSYPDTVYVTSNPYVDVVVEDVFFRTYSVWEELWDGEKGTVMPGELAEKAEEVASKHTDKRLIVHFMQPHHPFIGEHKITDTAWKIPDKEDSKVGIDEKGLTPWQGLERGKTEKEELWQAYADSLQEVYPVAKELGRKLEGKTVITSDHGNMMGERVFPLVSDYGHRPGILTWENTEVPWDVLPFKNRKTIREDEVSSREKEQSDEEIKEKLEALGYS